MQDYDSLEARLNRCEITQQQWGQMQVQHECLSVCTWSQPDDIKQTSCSSWIAVVIDNVGRCNIWNQQRCGCPSWLKTEQVAERLFCSNGTLLAAMYLCFVEPCRCALQMCIEWQATNMPSFHDNIIHTNINTSAWLMHGNAVMVKGCEPFAIFGRSAGQSHVYFAMQTTCMKSICTPWEICVESCRLMLGKLLLMTAS